MHIPQAVGIKKARRGHLKLWVSFPIVRIVVEQGQCIRKNKSVQRAVTQVQPLEISRLCS